MQISTTLQEAIDSQGARVRAHFPWWLRRVTSPDVVAITLGRRIYLRRTAQAAELEAIIRHELAHVSQVARLGLLRFYWSYLAEYIRHRRAGMTAGDAYRNISFEREAVLAEQRRT